jgi:hypothetical protein
MQYKKYTLHPIVEEYLYNNYKYFTTKSIFNEIFYTNNEEEYYSITYPISFINSISIDFFIKLEHIPIKSIKSITIRQEGFSSNDAFYKLNWLTIYLYNIRCHPELVKKKIFILPNLVILAYRFNYILEITFNTKILDIESNA